MPLIIINDDIGSVRRQRNVNRMWHRILFAVGHAQRERDAARYRGLNLLSRHNTILARRAETLKRLFTGLRLSEGIDLAALEADLQLPVRERYAAEIDRILREDLGSLQGSVLRLNERGLDLHTEVSLRFF